MGLTKDQKQLIADTLIDGLDNPSANQADQDQVLIEAAEIIGTLAFKARIPIWLIMGPMHQRFLRLGGHLCAPKDPKNDAN